MQPDPHDEIQAQQSPRGCGTMLYIGLAAIAVFAIIGILTNDGSRSSGGRSAATSNRVEPTPTPRLDAGGRLACRAYRGIFRDLNAGVLTDAEFRSAVQRAHRDAEISEDRQLAGGSQALLRALTTGTNQDAADALIVIHERCDRYGL